MRKRYTFLRRVPAFLIWIMLLSFPALFFSSCNEDDGPPPPTEDITQIIEGQEGLDSLNALLNLQSNGSPIFSDLIKELKRSDRTFFAPNNAAFDKLKEAIGINSLDELRLDILEDILYYHMVISAEALTANQLTGDLQTELDNETISANGTMLNETSQPDPIPTVVTSDIRATNGIIHIVDNLLLPSSITDDISPAFGTIAAYISLVDRFAEMDILLRGTDLWETVANDSKKFTLLGILNGGLANGGFNLNSFNLDDATKIGNYHIIEGLPFDEQIFPRSVPTLLQNEIIYTSELEDDVVRANYSVFLVETVELSNGKIYTPIGFNSNGEAVAFLLYPSSFRRTGVQYINRFSDLTLLAKAVERVPAIKSILEGTTPYTLLSPNNDAFEAAGITEAGIDTMAIATLQAVLENHIIQGKTIFSPELVSTTQGNLSFVAGTDDHVKVTDNNTTLSAETVFEDILLQVGVAHDIDNVLIP